MNNSQKIKTESRKLFDFSEVGKRTPFRTPEGFFEQQEQVLKKVVSSQKSSVRPLHRKWYYAAAASALLLIAIYPVMRLVNPSSDQPLTSVSDTAPVYSQTSSASDDWSEFADADVFLDNMNW